MKIKTGDKIVVIHGKDKGKQGVVLQVFTEQERVVIEGINVMTRHIKSRQRDQAGQKIQFPAPIAVSNIQLLSAKTGTRGRVGYKTIIHEDGSKKKIRVLKFKGTQEDIE
ncbi:50S ribosomal protein L24 [Candidatus Uhrbacteria bacterium CG_4_9_14_3_um_filter_36_7]|uniref:Large ribosomal subunit protein uL24 n=1 Tax=Candidatus Uhrbacteria bacterium CG_4_9_14_3_um_filter_36_7 TaxID=1975033 RepID=A0A2M7XHH8_9BACT|nr:MAG: 50S ribosomal protein L24 [Candidatus Uhrbacteria bacterium CG_4_9_14_3_um_filter_36_7]